MKVFLALDDKNGMMFFNKRQSKDSILREKILSIVGDNKLYMNSYTASQFDEKHLIIENDHFLDVIKEDDYCFIENIDFSITDVNEFIVFYWNRHYPGDKFFNYDFSDFNLVFEEDFKGTSHDKITMKRYKRN